MFQSAKDALTAKAAQAFLNTRIARYGDVERVKLDSRERTVEVSVRLIGEATPITVRVGRYEVHDLRGQKSVEVFNCTCSRPWIEHLLQDFAQGRRFDLPPWAAAAL